MHKTKVRVSCIMGMDIHMNVLIQRRPDIQKREPAISFLEMHIFLPLSPEKESHLCIITHESHCYS